MFDRKKPKIEPLPSNPDASERADADRDAPFLLDGPAVCGLLSIGLSTLYAMDRSGELGPKGLHLRRRRLWRREELLAWTRAGCPRREVWLELRKGLDDRG